jgi:threo-3-hydroxy-L-aspartate ammonia-lyase
MTALEPSAVAEAAARLAGIAHRTPVITSRMLNELTGREIFLKCENFQRVGAFKFRGAYHAISRLTAAQQAAGVITHSSGNHAQGIALAARLLGVRAVVVMPEDAPAVKRQATAAYGAHIVPCRAIEREQVTAELIDQHGYTLVHPFDNDDIIIGQGTAAWELFDEVGQLDTLFVPVGGGGLISGSALAAAGQAPACRVVGVEPEVAADAGRSWRDNQIYTLADVPDTLADGLRTRAIGRRNLAVMRRYVADMTAVSEAEILQAVEFIWSRLKMVVEPSAAVALAPLLSGRYAPVGQRVGVLLSGGNVNVQDFGFFHRRPSSAAQRNGQTARAATPTQPERPRILVCDPMDEAGLSALRPVADVDVQLHLDSEALLAQMGQYQAIIIGPRRHLSGQMIEYGFNLRAIGILGTRLDNVDVSTARSLGVEVYHAPDSNAVAIAEHTMSRLLMLAAQFGDARLAGKTLGLIGFGGVGQQVARRARAFDMRVIVNQPRLTPELALSVGAEATDLLDLLRQADFVSLHVPFKQETAAIIGASELAHLKRSACLINTGHTDLIDEAALLQALADGRLAGAALSTLPPQAGEQPAALALRRHPRVLVSPHITSIIGDRQREAAVAVAGQIAALLQTREASETLSLELAPIDQVIPHEQIDDKRVARLMERLEDDGRLVNPPVTTFWHGRYIILDGATRFTALQRLGYPHIIVQVVQPEQEGFALHTWYHAISSDKPFAALQEQLQRVDGLRLTALPAGEIQTAFQQEKDALCYFLDRAGHVTLAQAEPGADRLAVMNALVASYTAWGDVERTLLTDLSRLLAQFPQMTAVAVFPQFTPETVFTAASQGDLLPAGLTRFVIPGRILRLNADLARLKQDEPLAAKRAWFNQFLEEKLARSRLRYYQEPVILLDE